MTASSRVLILLVVLSLPLQARADDFAAHIAQAEAHFTAGRYDDAIAALLSAQALRDDPGILLNLGHAYRRLGSAEESLRHYARYLALPGLAEEEREAVRAYMAQARALLRPALSPAPPTQRSAAPAPVAKTASLRPLDSAAQLRLAPAQKQRPPLYRRWWFWGALGVAAAGVVTAAVVSAQPWDPGIPPQVPLHDARF